MAGIRVPHILSNILNFSPPMTDQKFLCLAEPEFGQILIDRTSQISRKEPGEVLGCDKDFPAECISGEVFHVPGVDAG